MPPAPPPAPDSRRRLPPSCPTRRIRLTPPSPISSPGISLPGFPWLSRSSATTAATRGSPSCAGPTVPSSETPTAPSSPFPTSRAPCRPPRLHHRRQHPPGSVYGLRPGPLGEPLHRRDTVPSNWQCPSRFPPPPFSTTPPSAKRPGRSRCTAASCRGDALARRPRSARPQRPQPPPCVPSSAGAKNRPRPHRRPISSPYTRSGTPARPGAARFSPTAPPLTPTTTPTPPGIPTPPPSGASAPRNSGLPPPAVPSSATSSPSSTRGSRPAECRCPPPLPDPPLPAMLSLETSHAPKGVPGPPELDGKEMPVALDEVVMDLLRAESPSH